MAATNARQGNENLDRAREEAGKSADRVKEAADKGMDKMRDAASHAGQALGSAATAAQGALGSAATTVGHKAEGAVSSVGSGLQSLGDKVRDKGPESGLLGKGTDAVASAMEQTGKYIEDRNLSGMADDVTSLIRRNPLPAMLVGVGVGFLLGQMMRR